jgi:hypothetical protein
VRRRAEACASADEAEEGEAFAWRDGVLALLCFAWPMVAWSAWLCGREREIAIEVVCLFT